MQNPCFCPSEPNPKRKIIRVQKSMEERLNKTEKRFLAYLRASFPYSRIGVQDFTLRLAADCRLTPDFSLWYDGDTHTSSKVELFDVKGPHQWEDSIIKLKTAAVLFPMFRFYLAHEQDGKWITQEIPR